MTKKKLLLISTLIIISFIAIIRSDSFNRNTIIQNEVVQLHPSYEASLSYGEYAYFSTEADKGDKFHWEFSGTNSYVGIKVYAMTDSEFYKFQNYQTFYSYKLSDGSYYRDSGTFRVTSYDTWYLVFLNADSDMQTTYLTYDLEIERAVDFTPIIVAIVIIVVCSVISILIGIAYRQKNKREVQPVYAPVQPQLYSKPVTITLPQPNNIIKFCSQCGTPQQRDVIYCAKCGNKFVS